MSHKPKSPASVIDMERRKKLDQVQQAISVAHRNADLVNTAHVCLAAFIADKLKVEGLALKDQDFLILYCDIRLGTAALQSIVTATGKPVLTMPAGSSLVALKAEHMEQLGWVRREVHEPKMIVVESVPVADEIKVNGE